MSSIDSMSSSVCSSQSSSCSNSPAKGVTSELSGKLGALRVTATRRELFWDEVPATVSQLEVVKNKIARSDSPPLLALKGQHAHDICLIGSLSNVNPDAVFKPGKVNSLKAMLCYDIANTLDLAESVPFAIEATAAQMISKEDLNHRGKPNIYVRIDIDGKPWIVNPIFCHEVIKEDCKVSLVEEEGCEFLLEKEAGEEGTSYNLKPLTEEARSHALSCAEVYVAEIDGKPHIIKCESALRVTDNSHVTRGDERFELRHSNGVLSEPSSDDECAFGNETPRAKFSESTEIPTTADPVVLVRANVEGFLQPMVQNVITEINDIPIDILYPSDEREIFYGMINKVSFIKALVLCALFRTQDGKCSFLEDSNILFTMNSDESLHLKLIDLDETMPEDNQKVRLGLMGYPYAHEHLEGNERAYMLGLLEKIVTRQDALLACIDKYELASREKIVIAFREILALIRNFYESETQDLFSLAHFIFKIFPNYEVEWNALSSMELSREEIANTIGFAYLQEKQEEIAARVVAAAANLAKAKQQVQ